MAVAAAAVEVTVVAEEGKAQLIEDEGVVIVAPMVGHAEVETVVANKVEVEEVEEN